MYLSLKCLLHSKTQSQWGWRQVSKGFYSVSGATKQLNGFFPT